MKESFNVPAPLRERKAWVHYKMVDRDGRKTKMPYQLNGSPASSVNPDHWADFTAAHASLANSGMDGLGIVLGDGLVGVDLDHVLSDKPGESYCHWEAANKYILNDALAIIRGLGSYTEISPSGDGIHILCFGSLPKGGNRRGFVEMYDHGRYFTFTGNTVPGYDEVTHRTEILAQMHSYFIGTQETKAEPKQAEHEETNISEREEEILRLAYKSRSGHNFKALYSGSITGYDSHSEADMALLHHLAFWTGKDERLMDSLFRKSGLMRTKWDKKRGAETYGQRAIKTACASCSETYTPRAKKRTAIQFKDVGELMKSDIQPIRWVIPDILPSGLAILASPPKYGKSWLVLDLCLAICKGSSFMGWSAEQGEALYFALEDSDRRLFERTSRLLCGGSAPEGLTYATSAMSLEEGFCRVLEDYLVRRPKTRLVVIDTLQKIRGSGSDQVYSSDYKDMAALKEVADRHNVCVLLIHHLRKSADDADTFNRISGSNGILGAVDTAWVLTRDNRTTKHTRLSVTGRDVNQSEQILWFNEAECRWYRKGTLEQATREAELEEYRLNPIVQEIIDIVEDRGGRWTGRTTELYDAISLTAKSGMSAASFGRLLRKIAPKLSMFSGIAFTPPTRNGGNIELFKLSES